MMTQETLLVGAFPLQKRKKERKKRKIRVSKIGKNAPAKRTLFLSSSKGLDFAPVLFCATLQESAFSFACFFVHTNNNRDDHIICAYCSHDDDDDVDDVKILFLFFFCQKI